MSITSDDYIINPAYNGTSDINLLLPGANGIPVGEKGAVLVTVMVNNCGSGQTGFPEHRQCQWYSAQRSNDHRHF
ncbi:MAG: hypothetical protein IPL65_09950 [Lewinellaceae bacterium]|nr:hypothetical protein [Lewinellaceae bacterium]